MVLFCVWAVVLVLRSTLGEELRFVDVFVRNQDGYPAYRIPSLLKTKSGALLAFAEGRANLSDHAENDIVLKRSTDHGATWGALQVVAADGTNALNNPCAVLLRPGRVILFYQRYLHGFDEHNAEPGLEGTKVCRTFQLNSDDEGISWSAPRDITSQVKRPTDVTSLASGPGVGIQLRKGVRAGRILMPFNQGPYGKWKVYAVFSDDGGQSWRYGATAPEGRAGHANEVQFVELSDGTVMLNARNQGGDHHRKVAVSGDGGDGGESWSETQLDPFLMDPVCQGSIISTENFRAGTATLLFCNPGSESARTNGTVRVSLDDGKTWEWKRTIYPGSFGYNCLADLGDGSVGCLFERDGYEKISFVRLSAEWLAGR